MTFAHNCPLIIKAESVEDGLVTGTIFQVGEPDSSFGLFSGRHEKCGLKVNHKISDSFELFSKAGFESRKFLIDSNLVKEIV